jgi:hypothetical protein
MTVQTEIVGQPAELVTIVDFRGRVLKTWRSPFTVDEADPEVGALARKWHADIEIKVRESLARAASQRGPNGQPAVSHLYLAAAKAYAERDFETALAVLSACDLLLPDDARIRAALRKISSRR